MAPPLDIAALAAVLLGLASALFMTVRAWRSSTPGENIVMGGSETGGFRWRWPRNWAFGCAVVMEILFAGFIVGFAFLWEGPWSGRGWAFVLAVLLPISTWSWLRRVADDRPDRRPGSIRQELD